MALNCRICTSTSVNKIGVLRPYLDYEFRVYACSTCGCRFVNRDKSIYEMLHANASTYSGHIQQAQRAQQYFCTGNLAALRGYLDKVKKNRFVMDVIDSLSRANKLLEVGCSRGYLASYFLLQGKDILGVDVSLSAISGARKSFGDHFVLPDDSRIYDGAPYDAIYHVGTIGCVEDPVGMIRSQLELLRSGGVLIFNAPNVDFALSTGRLWAETTPPPDLVTLFTPTFWHEQFLQDADVVCKMTNLSLIEQVLIQRHARRRKAGLGFLLKDEHEKVIETNIPVRWMRRLVSGGLHLADCMLPPSRTPAEFGVFVTMTKH